jgi:hypothetical protein
MRVADLHRAAGARVRSEKNCFSNGRDRDRDPRNTNKLRRACAEGFWNGCLSVVKHHRFEKT